LQVRPGHDASGHAGGQGQAACQGRMQGLTRSLATPGAEAQGLRQRGILAGGPDLVESLRVAGIGLPGLEGAVGRGAGVQAAGRPQRGLRIGAIPPQARRPA
jgi:hypothetical protein